MFKARLNSVVAWLFAGLSLFSCSLALADHLPPIAFSEYIVAETGIAATVDVELQFFDPSLESADPIEDPLPGQPLSNIIQSPANLAFAGGSAGTQACAFFRVCGYRILGFVGTDQLRFTIGSSELDDGEAVFSSPAVVQIEIVEQIDGAIAFRQDTGTYPDLAVPIKPGGVAPGNSELTYSIVTQPQNGTLDISTAEIRSPVVYTPAAGFEGVDQFEFTVTDGVTVSEPATIRIFVGVAGDPVITAIEPASGAISGGTAVTISGVNFQPGDVEVAFGEVVVTSTLSVNELSEIQLTSPPNLQGPVDVRVTTSQGDSTITSGFTYEGPVAALVSAVLPASRSVPVGIDATAFGVIVNAGNMALEDCGISPVTAVDASFAFQITDAVTNAVEGVENATVDIPANSAQNYVFRLTPNSNIEPTEVELMFECAGGLTAPSFPGVNTLLLSASDQPIPDVIAVAAVDSGDLPAGTLGINGPGGRALFAVATTNVGSAGSIEVESDTTLPVTISICETTDDCFDGSSDRLTTEMAANSVGTFFLLVEASAEIPFRPEASRIFVRFRDSQGVVRGSTSVAVTTD